MGNKAEKAEKGGSRGHTPSKANLDKSKSPKQFSFKVLAIGDQGVGKTSLVLRYVKNEFEDVGTVNHPPTEAQFEKSISVGANNVKLYIYDTQGQEGFRMITSSYYQGAQMVLICFDVGYKKSFESLKTWLQEAERYAKESTLKALIGTKSDTQKREVSEQTAKEFAQEVGLEYIETSSANGTNVDVVFETAAKAMVEAVLSGSMPYDFE